MEFLFLPDRHLLPFRAWALQHQAHASVDAVSFELQLRWQAQERRLRPRFAVRTARGLAYATQPAPEGYFVGWLPYAARTWPASTDKLVFKRAFAAAGLRVPPLLGAEGLADGDHVVKARRGSFGAQVRGPFRAGEGEALAPGEFREAFIVGRIVKAWFWDAQPCALERLEPAHVRGDGVRSIHELLAQPRGSMDKPFDSAPAQTMLAWQGLAADTVLPAGQRAWLGFKYVSGFERVSLADRNVLADLPATVTRQLAEAGRVARALMDEGGREPGVCTLDAICDPADRLWWLEMNSHPMIHPAVYPAMLSSLFATVCPRHE
jgi:hypothetical protein